MPDTDFMNCGNRACRLLHVFPSFDVGGSQVRLAQIANHFGGRYHHQILPIRGGTACAERLYRETPHEFLAPAPKGQGGLASLRHCRKRLTDIRPDVLVTYNWGAMDWAIANWPGRIPHIHVEDGFGPDEAVRQKQRRVWTRRLILRGSIVVLPSRTLVDIAEQVWRLPPQNIRYIPNGIDCARFTTGPATDMAALLPPDRLWIGTIAALRPEKRIDRLLRAFRLVTDRHPAGLAPTGLAIVGDGPERPNLESLASQLGLADRIVFTGHRAAPHRVVGAFDIMALSSDTEQMPYAVLEGMAAGLPIVATAVGDIANMVAPENRPFLTNRDHEPLGAALLHLLGTAPLRSRIGAANRHRALDHFDQAAMFAAYARIFDTTGQGRNVPAPPLVTEQPSP